MLETVDLLRRESKHQVVSIGKFTVFGIDSYGGFGSEAYSILQDIAKICSSKQTGKSYSETINFYYQRVSVALQTARAMQLEIMRSNVLLS